MASTSRRCSQCRGPIVPRPYRRPWQRTLGLLTPFRPYQCTTCGDRTWQVVLWPGPTMSGTFIVGAVMVVITLFAGFQILTFVIGREDGPEYVDAPGRGSNSRSMLLPQEPSPEPAAEAAPEAAVAEAESPSTTGEPAAVVAPQSPSTVQPPTVALPESAPVVEVPPQKPAAPAVAAVAPAPVKPAPSPEVVAPAAATPEPVVPVVAAAPPPAKPKAAPKVVAPPKPAAKPAVPTRTLQGISQSWDGSALRIVVVSGTPLMDARVSTGIDGMTYQIDIPGNWSVGPGVVNNVKLENSRVAYVRYGRMDGSLRVTLVVRDSKSKGAPPKANPTSDGLGLVLR